MVVYHCYYSIGYEGYYIQIEQMVASRLQHDTRRLYIETRPRRRRKS